MAWSEPLYDRTAQDVKDVQTIMNKILISGYDSLTEDEIDLVNGRTRGTFSANTMNRICNNLVYLQQVLEQAGYSILIETTNTTEWNYDSIVNYEDLLKIRNDCALIKNKIGSTYPLPIPSDMYYLTFTILNNIEKLINDVKIGLESVEASTVISGIAICGAHYTGGSIYGR